MRRYVAALVSAIALAVMLATAVLAGGFDPYGYNDSARIFVGAADGVDRILDDTVWGDPTYARDHLVMKWSEAWDACNAHGNNDPIYCVGAWLTNEWNGSVPGGSGQVWHYKIIWVGTLADQSPYWVAGGYSIWGAYEVIMDQGTDQLAGHTWLIRATPNGFGAHP